jgi:isocitrate dehydrogenase kinase/phosphatase
VEGLPSRRPGQAIAAVPQVGAEPAAWLDSAAARAIATVLIEGFDKHYRLFRATSTQAKEHFEAAAWAEAQQAVQERIRFYDDRVGECVERVRAEFDVESLDIGIWQEAKLFYIGLLVDHSQPELAETFFNSVITRILRRTYSDNDLIFVRAAMSNEYIDSDPPIYRCYYPNDGSLRECFEEIPFVVPVLNDAGRLSLDAILIDQDHLNVLFSLSRAYFMVDMAVPSGYVKFLRRMMPTKGRAELYTMLGLGKQGKTLFYRDLQHSQDAFVQAPGIQGQVMLVFTLPSYPYVFKVIKDVFGPGKDTDRETVAFLRPRTPKRSSLPSPGTASPETTSSPKSSPPSYSATRN